MYEFTLGGSWFRWSLLDRTSKRLAAASFAAATVAMVPLGAASWSIGYQLGKHAGSGSREPFRLAFTAEPWAVALLLGFTILSGIFWWRFSLRQDELFNRVQNLALGMGGAWSGALLTCWAVLDLGNLAPPVAPAAIIAIFFLLVCVFWFVGVRRWV
jgi:hypothetical protein